MTTQNNVVVQAKAQGFGAIRKEVQTLKQVLRGLHQDLASSEQETRDKARKRLSNPDDRRTRLGKAKAAIEARGIHSGVEAARVYGTGASFDPSQSPQERARSTIQGMVRDAGIEPPVTKAQTKAFDQMNNSYTKIIDKAKFYNRQQKELGHAANISAKEILALRVQIEKLRATQGFQTNATQSQINRLKMLEGQLATMQAQAVKNTSSFQFMAGASVMVQKGIRNVGAAAQGAMLAMSLLNGDIMGTAFSLIFLQFAANLPVALGFGAIAIAGVLAFKSIKKVYESKKEIKKFTDAFKIATGNVQAFALAEERAADVVGKLGIQGDQSEQARKVATQAILDMERRRQKVTQESVGVAVKAWLVSGRTAENEAERQQEALTAVQDHLKGTSVSIGGIMYDTAALNTATARELSVAKGTFMSYGETVGEAMRAMGRSEEELADISHEHQQMKMSDLFESSIAHDEDLREMQRYFNTMELEYQKDFGASVERLEGMIKNFDEEADEKGSTVSRLKEEGDKQIADMWRGVEQKELTNKELQRLDREYVEEYAKSISNILAESKRLTEYRATAFKESGSQDLGNYATWSDTKLLDAEMHTGKYLGDTVTAKRVNTTFDYAANQDLEYMWGQSDFRETGFNEVVITLEDQTSRGLTVAQTVSKQMQGVVTDTTGMASESGG